MVLSGQRRRVYTASLTTSPARCGPRLPETLTEKALNKEEDSEEGVGRCSRGYRVEGHSSITG